jgi:hypothetical protein
MMGGAIAMSADERKERVRWAIVAWSVALAIAAWVQVRHLMAADVWLVYSTAAHRWRAHVPIYDLDSIDDFQYFPQAAIVLIPIELLGRAGGDVVWRALGVALFAHGLWRVAGLGWKPPRDTVFFALTLLTIPAATTSLMNGQANLHVAALMMHTAVDLGARRRWRVTLWLTLGLALKPLMVVMLLLACVFDPSLIGRLALALGLLALLPLATAPVAFVVAQYHDCARKLAMSAQPDRFFEDLRGLLSELGWVIPHALLRALSGVAALGAALLCYRLRRSQDQRRAGLPLFAVAAAYLMLFNSRNQANSYVIIAPAAALPAVLFAWAGRWRAALAMTVMVACWCGSAIPLTAHWLKPLTCLVFCALLVRAIATDRWAWSDGT